MRVLSVSPNQEDHSSAQSIFDRSRWELYKSDGIGPALLILQRIEIGVVLCERDLSPGSWTDMLECLALNACPPALVVTSRLADDRLWDEALQRGAYDVLPKPYNQQELVRAVSTAWLDWSRRLAALIPNLRAAS